MYLTNKINLSIDRARRPLAKTHRSSEEIAKLLRRVVAPYRAYITTETSTNVDLGRIEVSAFFEPLPDKDTYAIELVLVTHPQTTSIKLRALVLNTFLFRVSQAIQHELIHAHQYRQRGWEGWSSRKQAPYNISHSAHYLSDPDEIDAHAHDVALELQRSRLDVSRLISARTITKDESLTLWGYYQTFPPHHGVINSLLKKTVSYLAYLPSTNRKTSK